DPCVSKTRASYSPTSIFSLATSDDSVTLCNVSTFGNVICGQNSFPWPNGKMEDDSPLLLETWKVYGKSFLSVTKYEYALCFGKSLRFSIRRPNTSGSGSIQTTFKPSRAYNSRSCPMLAPTWITPRTRFRNASGGA